MTAYHKYIHIFGHNEPRFSAAILGYFHDRTKHIIPEEHYFVTPHKMVYDTFSDQYANIEFSPDHIKKIGRKVDWDGELINEYAPYCDFIIIHRICSPLFLFRIKPEYYKKIVWRSWGGDAGFVYHDGKYIKNAMKFFYNHSIWRYIIKQFALIGIANSVDALDMTRHVGKVKMKNMPYPSNIDYFPMLEKIKAELKKEHESINVMIGHSGWQGDNHMHIIDLLSRFANEEKIHFYFPLSYGGEEYMEMVKKYALRKLGGAKPIL